MKKSAFYAIAFVSPFIAVDDTISSTLSATSDSAAVLGFANPATLFFADTEKGYPNIRR